MTWTTLADGSELVLAAPQLRPLCISTLAHHIAQINRFNGGAARPYSVAEHSLLVLDIAERYLDLDAEGLLCVLVHDLHEALCGDQTTPSKREIGIGWSVFEDRAERAVYGQLGLLDARLKYQAEIRYADLMALAIENKQLLPELQPDGSPRTPWPCLKGLMVDDRIDLMEKGRVRATWEDWRDDFMQRFSELDCARKLHL